MINILSPQRHCVASVIFAFFSTVSFAEASAVLCVLDGSGSMWAKVDGQTKIEVARSVMKGLVGRLHRVDLGRVHVAAGVRSTSRPT